MTCTIVCSQPERNTISLKFRFANISEHIVEQNEPRSRVNIELGVENSISLRKSVEYINLVHCVSFNGSKALIDSDRQTSVL